MNTYAVLADDFTGAAEAAAYLGKGTEIVMPPRFLLKGPGALLLPTRNVNAREAGEMVARTHLAGSLRWMVKMDSLCRGPWLAVLDALRERWPEHLQVICPAFPEQGRTVVNGRLYVHGKSGFDLRGAVGQDVPVVSQRHDLDAYVHSLHALGKRRAIVDASTPAVMRSLAKCAENDLCLLCCSSGALMHVCPQMQLVPPPMYASHVVCVNGSRTVLSRRQVARVAARDPSIDIIVAPTKDSQPENILHAMWLDLSGKMRPDTALVLIGGDTAQYMVDRLGAHAVRAVGVLEPGVPVLSALGHTIVTKSGSFGDDDCLVRLVKWAKGGSAQ